MIITVSNNITSQEIKEMTEYFKQRNVEINETSQEMLSFKKIFFLTGDTYKLDEQSVLCLPKVLSCVRLTKTYRLASLETKQEKTIVNINSQVSIGGKKIAFIAGPCSIVSYDDAKAIALGLSKLGIPIMRGGAYKPRTSPYFFQGLEEEGLKILSQIKKEFNIPIISEITKISDIDKFVDVDIIQVGARNMKNYELLKALGKQNKPVLLKRGPEATIDELLLSSEYILSNGNSNVILCERGIRSFDKSTRYILDLSSVPLLKKLTHLPVIVDPSHALGDFTLVESMVLAAIACGADGIMLEVLETPEKSLSDGKQSLKISKLENVMEKAQKVALAIGREI